MFPPYPRGLVRVTSMDVVRAIARTETLIYGDDPCAGSAERPSTVAPQSF